MNSLTYLVMKDYYGVTEYIVADTYAMFFSVLLLIFLSFWYKGVTLIKAVKVKLKKEVEDLVLYVQAP